MVTKNLLRYLKIWLRMSKNSFLMWFSQRFLFIVFLLGKIFRFFFFFFFLFLITKGTQTVAGYNSNQMIFFFLTFTLIDTISQFFFREVYRFRSLIVSGDFDLVLLKPVNSLFRVLLGGADFIDLLTLPFLIWGVYHFGQLLEPSMLDTTFYLVLVLNGLLIATAFHIVVLAMAIITSEIDHSIMIYRDLTSLARFPVDIYKEPLKGALTFLIPIGIMITLPGKALMGLISPVGVVLSLIFGIICVVISLKFWNYALKKYTSASS